MGRTITKVLSIGFVLMIISLISCGQTRQVKEIAVIINPGINPHDELFLMDLEKKLSSIHGVDSLFIYGITGLNASEIVFKPKEEMCNHYGLKGIDVVKYADSVYTTSSEFDYKDLEMIRYENIPIRALVDINLSSIDYKPEIFRNGKENINENEVKYVLYYTSEVEEELKESLSHYFDSIKKGAQLNISVRIE
ncbi:MAG: hypothetical protein MI866_22695 [Bacteroidales bacterium]|nr:hypothetical protein [Bacteroidales bacterium]